MASTMKLTVNGTVHTVIVDSPDMPLLWVLRDLLGLTGTKYGCGVEICGACTVMLGTDVVRSCQTNVSDAAGRPVLTIEGLAKDPDGRKAQAAWIAAQIPQCGYCQPGFLMATVAAMKAGHQGSEIAGELSNICLCGTYPRIAQAIATL